MFPPFTTSLIDNLFAGHIKDLAPASEPQTNRPPFPAANELLLYSCTGPMGRGLRSLTFAWKRIQNLPPAPRGAPWTLTKQMHDKSYTHQLLEYNVWNKKLILSLERATVTCGVPKRELLQSSDADRSELVKSLFTLNIWDKYDSRNLKSFRPRSNMWFKCRQHLSKGTFCTQSIIKICCNKRA